MRNAPDKMLYVSKTIVSVLMYFSIIVYRIIYVKVIL